MNGQFSQLNESLKEVFRNTSFFMVISETHANGN